MSLSGRLKLGADIVTEVARARVSPGRIRRVHFSESYPAWHTPLNRGLRAAGYRASFGPLDSPSIEANDLVVPLGLPELRQLARDRSLIGENPIPIPDAAVIELCEDKRAFSEALIGNGFGDHLPPIGGDLRYPYIVKKRVDESSQNSHLVADRAQELAVAHLIDDPDYFVQVFIPGSREYTAHLVVRNRRVVCALNIEYAYAVETPIKFHNDILRRAVCKSTHLEVFSSVLTSIGFEGICCLNYKLHQGRPQILEVNPRMGGSLAPLFFTFLRHL